MMEPPHSHSIFLPLPFLFLGLSQYSGSSHSSSTSPPSPQWAAERTNHLLMMEPPHSHSIFLPLPFLFPRRPRKGNSPMPVSCPPRTKAGLPPSTPHSSSSREGR